jgi:hypothetical protein
LTHGNKVDFGTQESATQYSKVKREEGRDSGVFDKKEVFDLSDKIIRTLCDRKRRGQQNLSRINQSYESNFLELLIHVVQKGERFLNLEAGNQRQVI